MYIDLYVCVYVIFVRCLSPSHGMHACNYTYMRAIIHIYIFLYVICLYIHQIVRWFLDYPGPSHLFAIQHLIQCGMKYDKLPGEQLY